jgi:uncharacterized protein DUF4291
LDLAPGLKLLENKRYIDQVTHWPRSGKHILAQADHESVIVYQAYRPSIAAYALGQRRFGGEFSFTRMSWIKPNFLWMMYRSGWGTKPGQEVTLAIRIRRAFFNDLLLQSVASTFSADQYPTLSEWQGALRASNVRLQWDPDRHPSGAALRRRALQLGLRGRALEEFADHEILEMLDISAFVAEQRENRTGMRLGQLLTPAEQVLVPDDPSVATRIGLSSGDLTGALTG